MQNIDTIIQGKWIIPIEPADTILTDYAIAIDQGIILAIKPKEDLLKEYSAREVILRNNHVLLPGLVNSHTHAAMSLLRGIADDLKLAEWLTKHIWPAESLWLSSEFVSVGSELSIAEMIRSGVTCFNDMYFFPESTIKSVMQAGMRAMISLHLLEFSNPWAKNIDECFSKATMVYDQYKKAEKIYFAIAPHSPHTMTKTTLLRAKAYAEERKIRYNIHLQETLCEIDYVKKHEGLRPIPYLQNLGLTNSNLIAMHVLHTDEEDLRILGENQVNIVHCPECNLKLASGYCQVQKLLQAGANVALGTDGPASNNDLDMLAEIKTAALLGKIIANDAAAINAHAALQMATINGAKALGINNQIGSLLPGKQADIIAINLDEIESLPLYNVASQIVYTVTRHQVTDSWVGGKALMLNRVLQTLDLDEIKVKVKTWNTKIRG